MNKEQQEAERLIILFSGMRHFAAICVKERLQDKMVLGGDYKFDEFESAKFLEKVLNHINDKPQ